MSGRGRLARRMARLLLPRRVLGAVEAERLLSRPGFVAASRPPPSGRIVVLAPHMDDETFGCGATLALAIAAGAEVAVVFLTDGAGGRVADPAESEPARRAAVARLVALRREEAGRALALLGVRRWRCLDFPDGHLATAPGVVPALAEVLREEAPQTVMLPFFTDPHPDHGATSRIFVAACAGASMAPTTEVWAYEIWAPLPANAVVDVSATMAVKQAAMACYGSQLADRDYVRTMSGLNAYRALTCPAGTAYAEAFFVAPVDAYSSLAGSA